MKPRAVEPLEAIVAHGSRMCWAGLMRPADEFPSPVKSRLAVMTTESGPHLRRGFGGWSDADHRFTSNISSPRIRVRELRPDERPPEGVPCLLVWARRRDFLASGKGGVCRADGWPERLWEAFLSEVDELPGETLAGRLMAFLESSKPGAGREVEGWRQSIRAGRPKQSTIGLRYVPVPAKLTTEDGGESLCIASWSPAGGLFESLSKALASREAERRLIDLVSQARYYSECILGQFHGVEFGGPDDSMEDRLYARGAQVAKIMDSFAKAERKRIADPKFGRLDRFG
jgi:hypothetical protein